MNKLQTQFDVSSLLLSDNSIHFDVHGVFDVKYAGNETCLLYTSPSPRDKRQSRMPSSA